MLVNYVQVLSNVGRHSSSKLRYLYGDIRPLHTALVAGGVLDIMSDYVT